MHAISQGEIDPGMKCLPGFDFCVFTGCYQVAGLKAIPARCEI
jgi:hypothetical protein